MHISIILCSTVLCVVLAAPVKQDLQEDHHYHQYDHCFKQSDHQQKQNFPVTVRLLSSPLLQSPLQMYDRLGLRALNSHSSSQNDMIVASSPLSSSSAVELKQPVFHLAPFGKPVQIQQDAKVSLLVNYGNVNHVIGDPESRYGNIFDSELPDHQNVKEDKIKSASDWNSMANVFKFPIVIITSDKNNSKFELNILNGYASGEKIYGVVLPSPFFKVWGQGTESKFPPLIEFWVQRAQRYYSNYIYEDSSRPSYDQQYYLEQHQQHIMDLESDFRSLDFRG